MRIVFVRHGEPDYEHDCLTETGVRQAEQAAERLKEEGPADGQFTDADARRFSRRGATVIR